MNRLICIVCLLMVSLVSMAQMEIHSSVSTSQTGGRFEIIQSPIARRLTFRLDKYTGDVYQYVVANSEITNEEEHVWKKINNPWVELVMGDKNNPDHIRYQLFMSGIALADCFLLDIETGATYLLYKDTETDGLFFSYMKDSYVLKEEKDKLD